MKTKWKLVLLFAMFILTGCSARELEFERTYPDTTRLDEYRSQIEKIYALSSNDITTKVIEQSIQPRNLLFTGGTIDDSANVATSHYCWGKSFRDCEKMRAIYPSEDPLMSTILNISVKANGQVKVTPDSIDSGLPHPQELEVYFYDSNRTIKMYEKVLNDGSSIFKFTAPNAANSYVFMIKAIYDGKLHGISYYTIRIDVEWELLKRAA